MKSTNYTSVLGSAILAGTLLATGVNAQMAPGEIKFMDDNSKIETSISGSAGDAVAGRNIFANRKLGNCLACHVNTEMTDKGGFHGEIGPPLEGVNERWEEAELRAILVDSKKALSEDTMMPGFYSLSAGIRIADKFKDKTILNAQQIEDVLAYVRTLK